MFEPLQQSALGEKQTVAPLRFAPVGMTILLPGSEFLAEPVAGITELSSRHGAWSSTLPLTSTLTGCPSHQRTWDKKDGAKPHQSSVFFFSVNTKPRVPHISLVFCEMWDTTALSRSPFPADSAYPTLRQLREGWGTRVLAFVEGVFLLREPHALYQRRHSKQEIRGSVLKSRTIQQPFLHLAKIAACKRSLKPGGRS